MRIAVLSGKGGTGKTFVSVNLACAAGKAVYTDCDVEEPNGHLFFRPTVTERTSVSVLVPEVDASKCLGCKRCVHFCRFNALAYAQGRLIIFPEVCHSCGGCILFCPAKALKEGKREIGTMEKGDSGEVTTLTGRLHTGEMSGVPIIKGLMERLPEQETTVIDCPPGSSCSVMESIRKADFCLMVAEPTLFGVHNLEMVYQLIRLFKKPFGAVLNKCLPGNNPADSFCTENQIPVLARIPYTDQLAKLNSKGQIAVREEESYREIFQALLEQILTEALL